MLRRKFPALFMPDGASGDHPANRTRIMPMQVLCVGLARTGCTCTVKQPRQMLTLVLLLIIL